jgi:hypothetical protein
MNNHLRIVITLATLSGAPAGESFAQHPAMPPGMTHDEHLARIQKEGELKKRGAAAMGFDQDRTTHHFLLYPTGGAIEVAVNDRADAASRDQVRAHLKDIAAEFAGGNFGKPSATHGEVLPGVDTLQERKGTVTFHYEDTRDGGRVRMTTSDSRALSALHEFLRYQIREHATGDPLTVRGVG